MPPVDLPPLLWTLLGAVLAMQLLMAIGMLVQGGRLRRIAARIEQLGAAAPVAEPGTPASAGSDSQDPAFRRFLDEDPARRELPKKEQFAAFRRWRNEQGLNWRPGESGGDGSTAD